MTVATLNLEKIIADIKLEQPTVLYGVSWEDYLEYTKATLDNSQYKITYNRRVLKIMGLAPKHENISRILDRLVALTGLFFGKNVVPAGSMTLVSNKLRKGADPDESYYIQNAHLANIKNKLFDDATDTPPDLVVEVDRTHSSDDKFEIYAAFGIKEFWLYSREVLHIFVLTETGEYLEAKQSVALPILRAEVLTEFISRAQKEEQFKVLSDFQDWL
ncbi:MAG: Uma2 family endonuclease [Acidobacteriota bacterium]|nr:Uma2 family endonuclease [Acidobacteriota bacterium]